MHYLHVQERATVEIRPDEIRFPKTFGVIRFLRAVEDEERSENEVIRAVELFRQRIARLFERQSTPENPITLGYRDLINLTQDDYAYFACPDCGDKLDSIDYSCYQRAYGNAEMTYGEPENHETNDYGDSDDYTYNCPHCGDEIDPFGLPMNIEMPMWTEFHRFLSDLFDGNPPNVAGQAVQFVNQITPLRRPALRESYLADEEEAIGMPIGKLDDEAVDLISQP